MKISLLELKSYNLKKKKKNHIPNCYRIALTNVALHYALNCLDSSNLKILDTNYICDFNDYKFNSKTTKVCLDPQF